MFNNPFKRLRQTAKVIFWGVLIAAAFFGWQLFGLDAQNEAPASAFVGWVLFISGCGIAGYLAGLLLCTLADHREDEAYRTASLDSIHRDLHQLSHELDSLDEHLAAADKPSAHPYQPHVEARHKEQLPHVG